MVKVIFHDTRNCSERKEFARSGKEFFPFREVPIMKWEGIEENHCLIQNSPFDVRNFFSVLAWPLHVIVSSHKKDLIRLQCISCKIN